MTLQDLVDLATLVAIAAAAWKFGWTRDVQSGETLRHLEVHFREFLIPWRCGTEELPGVARAVDTESLEFERKRLGSAIQKGLDGRGGTRDDLEEAWMPRLDAFLRFLLIVASMETNRLLKKRALWDVYHYWFRAVIRRPLLRTYVGLYFPVLSAFVEANRKMIDEYDELMAVSAAKARIGKEFSMVAEFRGFLTKTNALALAVGVIIGAAVGNIVTALASDILMPLIGVFLPGGSWREAKIPLDANNAILYGHFMGTVIDFLIISFVVFLILRTLVKPVPVPAAEPTKKCPECLEMIPEAAKRCRACTADLG